MPLIKEFIAEHEAVYNLSGDIRRALERDDIASAQRDLTQIQHDLRNHWAGDLTTPEGRELVLASLATLWPHIEKEEDGLFPMSLTTLSGDQWDAAIEAWERVHGRPVRR